MPEYIDREKMLKYLEENNTAEEWIIGQYNADWIYSFIESQPTADVVEAVRCTECKYKEDCARQMVHTTRDYVLEQNISTYNKVDFCSCGERRDT